MLKIDTKTIYNYVQRGVIPYLRIQSNVRFPKHQIREWIENRIFTPK
jgi:excisionase family DNA binding protein